MRITQKQITLRHGMEKKNEDCYKYNSRSEFTSQEAGRMGGDGRNV